jgi:hypothetical protein
MIVVMIVVMVNPFWEARARVSLGTRGHQLKVIISIGEFMVMVNPFGKARARVSLSTRGHQLKVIISIGEFIQR